jgi:hypothetical protein
MFYTKYVTNRSILQSYGADYCKKLRAETTQAEAYWQDPDPTPTHHFLHQKPHSSSRVLRRRIPTRPQKLDYVLSLIRSHLLIIIFNNGVIYWVMEPVASHTPKNCLTMRSVLVEGPRRPLPQTPSPHLVMPRWWRLPGGRTRPPDPSASRVSLGLKSRPLSRRPLGRSSTTGLDYALAHPLAQLIIIWFDKIMLGEYKRSQTHT